MSHDAIHNSSRPTLRVPKPTIHLNGAAFQGLGFSGMDVDDDIVFLVRGTITEKSKNHFQEGVTDIAFKVTELENRTPPKHMNLVDENNIRIIEMDDSNRIR